MEAGSKRAAKASSTAKHNTEKSKHINNPALKLRGKSAKYFKIKLGDTIFNGSMWYYVDVILKFEGIAMLLFLCIFENLKHFQCYPDLSVAKSHSVFFLP